VAHCVLVLHVFRQSEDFLGDACQSQTKS
jgi:hypothetical protein